MTKKGAFLGFFAAWAACFLVLLAIGTGHGLLGNCDSVIAVAIGNIDLAEFKAAISHEKIGRSLFPLEGPLFLGESSMLLGALFAVFKFLSNNDFLSYSLLVSLIVSGNIVSAWLLFRELTGSPFAAFAGSVVFSLNSFLICANIDSFHTICFAPAFLAFALLLRQEAPGRAPAENRRALLLVGALWGLEIYVSIYAFIVSAFILPLVLLCRRGRAASSSVSFAPFITAAILVGAPFWFAHLRSLSSKNFFNPFNNAALTELHSLNLDDFSRRAPGTRGYNQNHDIAYSKEDAAIVNYLPYPFAGFKPDPRAASSSARRSPALGLFAHSRRAAWPGFILPCLLVIASALLIRSGNQGLIWTCIVFYTAGLLIALGPITSAGAEGVIRSPLAFFYSHFSWLDYFRVPSRMYMLCIFAMAMLVSLGAARMTKREAKAAFGLILLYVAENVPTSPPVYNIPLIPSAELLKEAQKLSLSNDESLLHYPSELDLGIFNDWKPVFQWSREELYMNWQTYHKRNIPNGVQGYLTKPRMDLNEIARDINNPAKLARLKAEFATRYIFVHKNLFLYGYEQDEFARMKGNPALKSIYDSNELHVFKIL